MTASRKLLAAEPDMIDKAVRHFEDNRWQFERAAKNVAGLLGDSPALSPYAHFIKWRVKDLDHLRDKLRRKARDRNELLAAKAGRVPPEITAQNLFSTVTDLAGVRLIHLHSNQFEAIHGEILKLFKQEQYALVEKPMASCWDGEFRSVYASLGLRTRDTEGYSSVHYVFRVNKKTGVTCELQVRTLTDEVWGEVSHRVNYPHNSPSPHCKQQLRTLARLTTGCTRLVDTIFQLDAEARAPQAAPKASSK